MNDEYPTTDNSAVVPPGAGEIHVWRASLEQPAGHMAELREFLTPDENERAGRYIWDEAKRHFTAGRGILRALLGRYLAQHPLRVGIEYNEYGRPRLAGGSDRGLLFFNLSHSGGMALYAFARGNPVGVDIERIRELDILGIAKRFFAPAEYANLVSLPESGRNEAFFRCWTRKEAFVKAEGTGLRLDLSRVEVTLGPGAPPRILRVGSSIEDGAEWTLRDLDAGQGFAAAMAVRAPDAKVVMLDYPNHVHRE